MAAARYGSYSELALPLVQFRTTLNPTTRAAPDRRTPAPLSPDCRPAARADRQGRVCRRRAAAGRARPGPAARREPALGARGADRARGRGLGRGPHGLGRVCAGPLAPREQAGGAHRMGPAGADPRAPRDRGRDGRHCGCRGQAQGHRRHEPRHRNDARARRPRNTAARGRPRIPRGHRQCRRQRRAGGNGAELLGFAQRPDLHAPGRLLRDGGLLALGDCRARGHPRRRGRARPRGRTRRHARPHGQLASTIQRELAPREKTSSPSDSHTTRVPR